MSRADLLNRLLREARRAHEDEDGSSMVFGAITLFTLALFTIMVWVIGMNSGDRLQAQSAADSAAYSGALVEAEALESIAFLNDGMAYVYYTECRYAIDAIVYSTLQAFHEHDQTPKARTEASNYTTGPTPGEIREISVGPQKNNPGARAASNNYTPGIEVAGPIPMSGHPAQSIDYGWVEMGVTNSGANGTLFEQRFKFAMNRADGLLRRGKRWLADIHVAERVILFATPQLVKKTCIDIAQQNGAEWVSISRDIDEVFKIGGQGGFIEGSTNNTEMNGGLVERYTANKANPIDGKVRKFPSWFTGISGQLTQDYSQVRLCWNKRDWDHCEKQGYYPDHQQAPYTNFNSGAPAGHWHIAHVHHIDRLNPMDGSLWSIDPVYGAPNGNGGPFTHNFGHGVQSGQDAGEHAAPQTPHLSEGYKTGFEYGWARFSQTDLSDPGGAHHMTQNCPTCLNDTQGSRYSEVMHKFNDSSSGGKWAINRYSPTVLTEVKFQGGSEPQPRPLLLKGRALRGGVAVATWRKGRGLTPQHFAPNDFGVFAVAAAQVGIRNPQNNVVAVPQTVSDQRATYVYTNGNSQRVVDINANANNQGVDNFFLGSGDQGDPGFRFGARLVPVKRQLSWIDDTSNPARKGLEDLFDGPRWYKTVPNGAVQPGQTPSAELLTAITQLKKFMDVRSAESFAQ
ncbi:MAG: pilus assembly protein TadG-related protein [Planctomycetota bacterium]